MDTLAPLVSDRTTLTEARNKVEELRLWVETELDRSKLGSRADDALESLHLALENRRASLSATLDEIQDEVNALPSEYEPHRREHVSNLGLSYGRRVA